MSSLYTSADKKALNDLLEKIEEAEEKIEDFKYEKQRSEEKEAIESSYDLQIEAENNRYEAEIAHNEEEYESRKKTLEKENEIAKSIFDDEMYYRQTEWKREQEQEYDDFVKCLDDKYNKDKEIYAETIKAHSEQLDSDLEKFKDNQTNEYNIRKDTLDKELDELKKEKDKEYTAESRRLEDSMTLFKRNQEAL